MQQIIINSINILKKPFLGRASRSTYISNIVTNICLALIINYLINTNNKQNTVIDFIVYILFAVLVFFFVQFYFLFIRRLHDVNINPLTLLKIAIGFVICSIIVSLILFFCKSIASVFFMTIWLPILFVCYKILVITLMFKKGTPGANKYGEPPVN